MLGLLDELMGHPILTARLILKRIKEIPTKGLPRVHRNEAEDFDRKYGVETSKWVQIVLTDSPNFSHGNRYSASSESAVRWSIENYGLIYDQTTFVDLGCGKGRVLILAAMYPFKRIIGVEYSPDLAAICSGNLRKLNLTNRCEVIVGDAADFDFPAGNLFVFLYNPFDATILKRVLNRLAATEGNVRIAQLGPGHDVIQNSGIARAIGFGDGPVLYEIVGGFQDGTSEHRATSK